MAKIKVLSKCELYDGMSITFRAPCDCTAVDGLKVYYNEYSQSFSFRDAQGSDLAGLDGLFAEGAYIKAILDTGRGYAYLQNADTNSYIENNFKNNFYLKDETLTNATKSMYGLGIHATPNTIFQKLAMPYGYYGFDITVVTEDGDPVPNVILNGLEDFEGNVPVTNENGRYEIAVSASQTPTLTIGNHIGIADGTFALETNAEYVFTPITITVHLDTATRFIDTTSEYRIYTPANAVVDLCTIGGGGGGGKSNTGDGTYGGGGGGGYCTNLTNISTISNGSALSFSIGGGGAAGGGKGGATTIKCNGEVLLQADGGNGGAGFVQGKGSGGGAGNGRGGHSQTPSQGVDASVYLFDDTSLGLPGGGGGGGSPNYDYSTSTPGAGGKPYGGACGKGGTGTGGGGGAGDNMWATGGGYKGGAYARVRFSS